MKMRKNKQFNIIESTKDGKKIKLKFDNSKEFIERYDEITPFLVRKGETVKVLHMENKKDEEEEKKKSKSSIIIEDVQYDFSDPEYETRIFTGYIAEKLDKPMEG